MAGSATHDRHDAGRILAGSEPFAGNEDYNQGQAFVYPRTGLGGPTPEDTFWQQLIGRLGQLFGPQMMQLRATGAPLAPAGMVPDPSTTTGVVFEHAGRTEVQPEPGPTREIEGNIPTLPRGQGADVPGFVHIVHHVSHTVPEGNAWWATGRILVPTSAPYRLVPANPKRNRLTILNTDTANSIDIMPDDNVTAFGQNNGFPLTFGASIDIRTVREVWAIAQTAPVVIAFKAEFAERGTGSGGGEQ